MADVFDLVAAKRRELATTLDGLSDDQWSHPSLCAGWRVRDVVAHLVWPAETSMLKIMVKMAGKGFAFEHRFPAALTA